jgi:hypothetical protein
VAFVVPKPNAFDAVSGAREDMPLIGPGFSAAESMKGMVAAVPGPARAPLDMTWRHGVFDHPNLASRVRLLREHAAALEMRLRTTTLSPNQETELLEELRKTINRLRILEGRGATPGTFGTAGRTAEEDSTESSNAGEPEPRRAGSRRKVVAVVAVVLLLAVAVGWALYHSEKGTQSPLDAWGPRWKDESATHFTFAASANFGDPMGIDSSALVQRAREAGVSFLLALGDLGNSTGEPATCNQIKSYVPELVSVPGTDEVGGNGTGNITGYLASCPYPLSAPVVAGNETAGYPYEYYFDYPQARPLARFIMISPGLGTTGQYNYSEESPHTEWVEDAVRDARDRGIPWVIVGAHAQCVTVARRAHCPMGQGIFGELIEEGVDLVLVGHDHVYERSRQFRSSDACESANFTNSFVPSCLVSEGSPSMYRKDNGTVVVAQGVGGEGLENITLNGSDPEVGYFAEAMGRNTNTLGALPGFGSVFYTVTSQSIVGKTDFCPPGSVAPDGRCTASPSNVFTDRFSIVNSTSNASLSASGLLASGAANVYDESLATNQAVVAPRVTGIRVSAVP